MAKKKKAAKADSNSKQASAKPHIQSIKAPRPIAGKGKKKQRNKSTKRNIDRPRLLSEFELSEPIEPSSFPNTKTDNSGNCSPKGTIPNLRHLLNEYGISVWYDVIAKRTIVIIPGLTGCPDNADNVALSQVISLAIHNGMPHSHIGPYLVAIGDEAQKNPIAEWILSKPWDGKDRLKPFYMTLQTKPDFPKKLKRTLIFRWLISAVAAAAMPAGFHSRGVLVLQGKQSIGKTKWIRNLVPDPFLQERYIKTDHFLDAGNKDSKKTALSHWIVELGELESSLERNMAQLKSFITGNMDKLRLPYAKADSEFSRRTVLTATVNKADFLVDDTGNTRWWTLPLTHIDYDHDIDMQQLFAEVYALFTYGEQWWLTDAEEHQLETYNKDHQATSLIRDLLESKVDFTKTANPKANPLMSISEILQTVGIQNPTTSQTRECGQILRGLLGEPSKSNGKRGWRLVFRPSADVTGLY